MVKRVRATSGVAQAERPSDDTVAEAVSAAATADPRINAWPWGIVVAALAGRHPRLAAIIASQMAHEPVAMPLTRLTDPGHRFGETPLPGLKGALQALTLRVSLPPLPDSFETIPERQRLLAVFGATQHDAHEVLAESALHFAYRHFGSVLAAPYGRMTVREMLLNGDPESTAVMTTGLVHLLALAAVVTEPVDWPVLVPDDAPCADARRALLATLAPRRGTRGDVLKNSLTSLKSDEDGLTCHVRQRHGYPVEVRILSTGEMADKTRHSLENEAIAVATLYDVINEPFPGEMQLLERWFAPRHAAVLEALTAYLQPAPHTDERLAWEYDESKSEYDAITIRRQRRRAKGDGYIKGSPIDPQRVLNLDAPWVSDQDRQAATLKASFVSSVKVLLGLAGHPFVFDAAGNALIVEASTVDVALQDHSEMGATEVAFSVDGIPVPPDRVRVPGVILGPRTDDDDDDDDDEHRPDERTTSNRKRKATTTATPQRLLVAPVDKRLETLATAVRRSPRIPVEARGEVERIADVVAALPEQSVRLPPSLLGVAREGKARPVMRLALTDPLHLEARLSIVPGDGAGFVTPGDGPEHALALVDGQRLRYQRDLTAERDLALPLMKALIGDDVDETAADDDDEFAVFADGDRAIRLFERASTLGCEVVWRDHRRLSVSTPVAAKAVKLRLSRMKQWLGLEGEAAVDEESLSLAAILAAIRQQRRYVRVSGDRFVTLADDLRDSLRGLAGLTTDDESADGKGADGKGADGKGAGAFHFSMAVAPALDALANAGVEFEEGAAWKQMRERLERARAVDDEIPAGLKAELRPYQREGLLFLRRLAAFGIGGILADDMGLGKTVQAIGLLVDRMKMGPAVVVAPTSLIFNWMRELERFAPTLRVHVYGEATDRAALLGVMTKRDVLLVSYGLVDDAFAKSAFATAIFDEAQALKNADTIRARACRDLGAELKIGLSGTPLENHLGELWSLFRIVAPGVFGSMDQFRQRFLLPIERDRSAQHRRQLGAAIRPFLLRRTKAQVLPDLPELTEQLIDVTSSDEERAIYNALRAEILEDLDDDADVERQKDRRFRVLAGLTRLRLCCCHPVLVEPSFTGRASKLDAAISTLKHVRAAGHKALVFSQFVTFLNLIEPALVAAGLRVLRLDGSTPPAKRRAAVDAFQAGDADIFLLSLKAGGAGLNLTAADVVVHLDPWWNPAVEAQAIGRAHRLGRVEPVTAIRLVVRDTIEAAILKMHDDKRELVDGVLAGADGGGTLGMEEIAALLRDA